MDGTKKVILSEVTQPQKKKNVYTQLQVQFSHNVQDNHGEIHKPRETKKEGELKAGTCAFFQEEKIEQIAQVYCSIYG